MPASAFVSLSVFLFVCLCVFLSVFLSVCLFLSFRKINETCIFKYNFFSFLRNQQPKEGTKSCKIGIFLVAKSNSIRGFVRLSIRPSVHWSVGPSVRWPVGLSGRWVVGPLVRNAFSQTRAGRILCRVSGLVTTIKKLLFVEP